MSIKKIFAVVSAAIIPAIAFAELDQESLNRCAKLNGELERLECFDRLTQPREKTVTNTSSPIHDMGKWYVKTEVNPVDDTKTVSLALVSDSGKGRLGKPIALIIRCKSYETDFMLGWHDYMGPDVDVLTRIGNQSASTRRWNVSTDSRATFHPSPIPFITEMMQADRLVAQAAPYNASPITAIFDIRGLANAIQPLRDTCGW